MADTFTVPAGWEEVAAPAPFKAPDGWEEFTPSDASDQAKLRDLVDRVNVKQTPEWWADRRREAVLADADPLAKAPAIISEPYRAVASAGASIGSTIARPFSKDAADYLAKTRQDIGDVGEAARADDWSPWLSRMYGGAVESITQAGVAAPLGTAGIIGSFAATEGNQALYDAEQAGLEGADRIKYAVVQGAIEGTIAGVFQRFAPGLERFIPQIAGGAMKLSGKQFLKMTAQELPEELLTELGHAVTEASYGIDPKATDTQQLVSRMVDTVAQTIGTLGLAQGAARLAQNRQKIESLEGIRSKGFVSKEEAQQLGMTPEESKNRETRKAAVDKRIQETQQEIERAEAVQPEEEPEVRQAPAEAAPQAEVQQPVLTPEPVAETPAQPESEPPPVDEDRVSELFKRRHGGKTGNRGLDARREETIRREVTEEAEAARQYPPGTTLEIEGYQTPFEVQPDGTLVEIATGRQMGDNAGAILRQYTPEQIRVISRPETEPAKTGADSGTDFGTSGTPETDPPIPEGMTRLYHGSGEHGRYTGPAWYSTNREYAQNYRGKDAELQYVDVPTDWAMQQLDPDGYGTPASTLELKNDEFGPRKPLTAPQAPTQPLTPSDVQPTTEAVQQPVTQQQAAQEPVAVKPKRGRKPKPPSEPQTLMQAVQSLGGLSGTKLSGGERINIREDLHQFGLLGAMQGRSGKRGTKGIHDLEEMARELESGGYWKAPEGSSKGDALLQALKEGALTFSGMEKQTEREYAAYQAEFDQEVSNAREQGEEAEQSLREGLRAGAEAGLSEIEATEDEAREVLGEVDLSFDFGANVSGDTLGIAGSVPISGQKSEFGRSVQHFFQRFFTSRGELPQEVYDAKVRKEGRVAKEMAHLRFSAEDFRRGTKAALGGKELTQSDIEKMNAVLRGEADETKVPEDVRAPLRAMRDHIDSLSRMLISEGVAQGDLVGTITENMGLYTTRSYRVFDDPKWRDKVPPAVRNRAVAAIRQMAPDKSDAEVQGLLESLLFRGAADSPVALLKGSKLGSKDVSTFMKRKDVPEWLRDLWGEYKDAGVNYARSVFKMSHLLANQQFLNSVKESGSGKWLRTAEDGPVVNEFGDVIAQIASEGSSTMEPLNGMYTTPEIKAAFERLDSPGAVPEWLRVLMAVNYAVKYSKTVGSMMTHVRNLISNSGFAVANGHWQLDKSGKALWGTATGMFSRPDTEFREYYKRAAELGLVGEDVRAGELKDALRDASQADIDEFLYNPHARQAKKIVSAGRGGVRLINSLYQAEDGVWKLYAWENEKARYKKAHPGWSQEQVEERAAEIVRDTYPTYSKIPEAVKGLRRFPLVGTFVSFPSEVVRTTFHTIELGIKEMQSPETREIGAQRLAGTVVALGALSVLSRAMMAMFGIGDDEDEDLRWFVPPWQENSRFIYTDKPENGIYKLVDLGYSDPHAYLTDAAIAFMRGDNWQDGLSKAMKEFLRPFASEEILAKTLMDVRSNEDQSIYNPKDTAGEQAKDIVSHVWGKALEPGTLTSLRRINTAVKGTDPNLDAKNEIIAMTTGQRLQKVDVEHSLGFRVREFAKALTDIQSIARKTATSRGTATGEMVATDRERMEKLRLAEFAQMQKILGAARRLGVPEEKLRAMVTGELPDDVAKQVMSGDYAPYEMTPQTVRQMLEANPKEFKERFSAWHGEKLPQAKRELQRKGNAAALQKLYAE